MSRLPCTGVLSPRRQETALTSHTVLDHDDMHHLVNGMSLEVARQAERIRRRSHGQDWPGAASSMNELEEAVRVLGQMLHVTLRSSVAPAELPADDEDGGEPPADPPTGQYL